jgi:dihydropteroate synthase
VSASDELPRPSVIGIENVTPDSFSDGGDHLDHDAAVAHGRRLLAEGAAALDVGGESTRPGAEPVALQEELRRVLPVVEELASAGALVSIDTCKAEVAARALAAGARMVNDVTALRGDPRMAETVAGSGALVCLMHMLGEPRTMQDDPRYGDVVDEVARFLEQRLAVAIAAGIDEGQVLLDPGIGFGKTVAHNLSLLRATRRLGELGRPLLVGASRKRFLGALTGREQPKERVAGSLAAALCAFTGGAAVFRVHDVAPTVDALRVARAVEGAA